MELSLSKVVKSVCMGQIWVENFLFKISSMLGYNERARYGYASRSLQILSDRSHIDGKVGQA